MSRILRLGLCTVCSAGGRDQDQWNEAPGAAAATSSWWAACPRPPGHSACRRFGEPSEVRPSLQICVSCSVVGGLVPEWFCFGALWCLLKMPLASMLSCLAREPSDGGSCVLLRSGHHGCLAGQLQWLQDGSRRHCLPLWRQDAGALVKPELA